jgi:hypothetical protein
VVAPDLLLLQSSEVRTLALLMLSFKIFCYLCRSTWDQRGNCGPILVTVSLYRILQLDVFVISPFSGFTLRSIRFVNTVLQGIIPSSRVLHFRSTRN